MWRNGELSLAYLTVDGASPEQHVEAAAAAGYSLAGVRILPPIHLDAANALVGNPAGTKRLATRVRDCGVGLLDAEVLSLTSTTDTDAIAGFVDTAAELGFRFVQTVVDDDDLAAAAGKLAELARRAEPAGIGVALEFMAFRPLNSLDAALELIETTGASNIGLVIDALHFARTGTPFAAIGELRADRIALAQLCDAPRQSPAAEDLATEARGARLHPGEGGLDLTAFLDALPDGTPLSLEVPHPGFPALDYPARAREALAAARDFLARRGTG